MRWQKGPAQTRQKPPRRQRGFPGSACARTVRNERLLFPSGNPIKTPPHLVRDRCVCDISSDNFRVCETRKGGVWLLKFDWLQLQTRGKMEVSKEGELAGSGKFGNVRDSAFQLKRILMNSS